MHSLNRRTLPALLLSLACTLAGAADSAPEPTPAKPDPLGSARAAIQAGRWAAASDEL